MRLAEYGGAAPYDKRFIVEGREREISRVALLLTFQKIGLAALYTVLSLFSLFMERDGYVRGLRVGVGRYVMEETRGCGK